MNGVSEAEQDTLRIKEEARLGWLALTLTPGMGPTRITRAIAGLGEGRGRGAAERVFTAALTELEGLRMPASAAHN